jgi:cell division protein FtsZ
MKGARGLLISITGGKDLTLYEVDEGATRIREEVDPDANIIVGATFDESLEGIIRVSVVATGIDHIATQQPVRPPETRIAEITQRLRADTQRIAADPPARPEPQTRATQAAPAPAPRASFEQAATAAVAAALLPQERHEEVTVRAITPKPSLFVEPVLADPILEEVPTTFIPPQAERTSRSPRMPRIDELPMPAQNEIRAQRGEITEENPERRRLTLLQRLAQVGLGRREEEATAPPEQAAPRTPMPPVPSRPSVRMPDPVSDYAKRPPAPAPQGLDIHGRQAPPVHKAVDDDQLEIPAFLRRQAN